MKFSDIKNPQLKDFVMGVLVRLAGEPIMDGIEDVVFPVQVSPELIAVCEQEITKFFSDHPPSPYDVYDFYSFGYDTSDYDPMFPLCHCLDLVIETYWMY